MFPIKDENPTRTFPFVNYLLLAANVAAFIWQWLLMQQSGESAIVAGYGLVPTRLLADPAGEGFTIFTSMFMHGGLGHLAGNLLYLYIFGDNVEDTLGHARYVGFYALSGVAAAAAQLLTGLHSPVPMVGASGAISGVLGAYIVLFPRAPILVFNSIPLLWLFWGLFLSFPAWLVIGFWFIGNLLSGVSSLGLGSAGGAGVAFFAHIGGFCAGLLLVRPLLAGRTRQQTEAWHGWRPPPRRRVSRSRYEAWRDR